MNRWTSCYMIGEIGSCHERFLKEAKSMIWDVDDSEYNCANAVKFQYFSDSQKVSAKRHAPEYADMYERYRLPADWLPELAAEAALHGTDFMCTVYLKEDIAIVAPFVKTFKIASCDALDRDFLNAHLEYQKPIYMSVGLLTEPELDTVLRWREELGREHLKLLYCVSAYPCPLDEVNLSAITRYDLDGFSDHTANPVMGALAYAAGARIIEAHVRAHLTPRSNPDFGHALDPKQWCTYVKNVRAAELAIGNGLKQTQPSEQPLRKFLACASS